MCYNRKTLESIWVKRERAQKAICYKSIYLLVQIGRSTRQRRLVLPGEWEKRWLGTTFFLMWWKHCADRVITVMLHKCKWFQKPLNCIRGLKVLYQFKKKPPHVSLTVFDSIKFCHTCFIFSVFITFPLILKNPDIIFLCILIASLKIWTFSWVTTVLLLMRMVPWSIFYWLSRLTCLNWGPWKGPLCFASFAVVSWPVLLELSYCLLIHGVILLDYIFPTSSVKQKLALKTWSDSIQSVFGMCIIFLSFSLRFLI